VWSSEINAVFTVGLLEQEGTNDWWCGGGARVTVPRMLDVVVW
jgi:hypothetical protein